MLISFVCELILITGGVYITVKKIVTISNILMYKSIIDNHYIQYLELANTYDDFLTKPYSETSEELYKI